MDTKEKSQKEKKNRKNKNRTNRKNFKLLNNKIYRLAIWGFLLIIFEIIVNDAVLPIIPQCGWGVVVQNIVRIICLLISTIASIILVSVIWEFVGKEDFSNELLQTMGMSKNVIDSGITDYKKSTAMNWESCFLHSSRIEMLLAFGESWVDEDSEKMQLLKDFVAKAERKAIIILPDFTKDKVVEALLVKYPKNRSQLNTADSIKDRLKNVVKGFWAISTSIDIRLYNGVNSASYFFFDEDCYFSPYTHIDDKNIAIPMILVQNNNKEKSFYEFCKKDMENIKNESTQAQEIVELKECYENLLREENSK